MTADNRVKFCFRITPMMKRKIKAEACLHGMTVEQFMSHIVLYYMQNGSDQFLRSLNQEILDVTAAAPSLPSTMH